MRRLKALIVLGRFHFVFGGLLLYFLGYLLAVSSGSPFAADRFFWGYAILFFAHLSVSYSNDYFDAKGDRISKPTLFSGGSGVLVRRPELAGTAKKIALSLIALSFLAAVGFLSAYGFSFPLLLYVLIGNLCGWYYSAPPLRFSHRIWGNLVFALTVCILVPGFGNYIASETISYEMRLFAIPLLVYGYAFTIGVQIPDIEADRRNNKRNFASIFGDKASYAAIAALCLLATASMAAIPRLFDTGVNYRNIFFYSLIPLAASSYSLVSKNRKTEARIIPMISSVFLFAALCGLHLAVAHL